jgi:hypothetical protein
MGTRSLLSGRVPLGYGREARRPAPLYRVVLAALLLLSVANLTVGLASTCC